MNAVGDTQATGGVTRPPLAIELRGISKSFGEVRANDNIDLAVPAGSIHGIIGENGAGKSTLMSIMYGFYRPDSGQIFVNGKPADITDSQTAIAHGIGMVFQHFKLVRNFTVLENIILGAEDGFALRGSKARAREELKRLAAEYELDVDPDARIETLSVGHLQRVEILKALYRHAEILILDEPTGVLTPAEADHLFRILKGLKDEGKTILLITHKLREIMDITDNVSVMRQGQMVAAVRTADSSPAALAELMVGRSVSLDIPRGPARPGAEVLSVEGLRVVDATGVERLRGINLNVRAGEILGIAGVSGNGQTALLEVLGGFPEKGSTLKGRISLNGHDLPLQGRGADAGARRQAGMGHIPEDRQAEGLIMDFTAWENTPFGYHHEPDYNRGALLDRSAIRVDAIDKIERFDIRPPLPDLPAQNFSGGNQQKIVVAREIDRQPDLLLVGQPTRGVDIGAIEFIHRQIIALRDAGRAVLLVSVELDEILSLSDRIAVMFDGRIMGERLPSETTAGELGMLMAGLDPSQASPEQGIPPASGQTPLSPEPQNDRVNPQPDTLSNPDRRGTI